ncbi:MAG TPA: succinate dehydrogenase assembly factor 2, partial [Burkholderiaceae bacterium]|nr:succinate dehydrogenase assembly factor 2 [Burkholderiaceae bacterium]
FLDEHEAALTDADVAGLDRLLDLSDNELLDLILVRAEPGADLPEEARRVLAWLRGA